MNKLMISAIGAALALAFSAGVMAAPTMSKADYKAAQDSIAADYKSAKAACESKTANAKDICMAEAHGRQKVAMAELNARNTPSSNTRLAVLLAKADSDYALAKEKCDDRTGSDKQVCVKEARSAHASATAAARAEEKTASKPASTSKKDSPGEVVDDAVISTKVKAALLAELKSAEINVKTSKGRVQLSGFVSSRADINKAVEIAGGVKGVKSVKNDMILKGTQ